MFNNKSDPYYQHQSQSSPYHGSPLPHPQITTTNNNPGTDDNHTSKLQSNHYPQYHLVESYHHPMRPPLPSHQSIYQYHQPQPSINMTMTVSQPQQQFSSRPSTQETTGNHNQLHDDHSTENNSHNSNGKLSSRRGPWSPLEDKKLLDLISIYGPTNWVRISNSLETRTPKQCRERYHQNLKPSLNRTPITPEEGELIENLVLKYGKKWAEISRHLNGRSDNAIKNWWNGGANRRRRASFAPVTTNATKRKSIDYDDENHSMSASNSISSSSSSQLQNSEHNEVQQAQQQQTQHLPQISFNTSMFGEERNSTLKTNNNPLPNISKLTALSSSSANNINHNQQPTQFQQIPNQPIINVHRNSATHRSASFDHNATAALPPISQTNKRRLIDDSYSRRHSSVNSMLAYAHSNNSSHSNLHKTFSNSNNVATNGATSGNVSPHFGSPLLIGSSLQASRQNSITTFELGRDTYHNHHVSFTDNLSRRSSSIAPDFFPNPLKENQKRNISQNSSFNSPLLTPSTRFSISSMNSSTFVPNHNSSSVTSPSHSYKLEFAASNTSINEKKEESSATTSQSQPASQKPSSSSSSVSSQRKGSVESKTKMSVSSLVD